jgi:hypothetical protein
MATVEREGRLSDFLAAVNKARKSSRNWSTLVSRDNPVRQTFCV